MTLDGIQATVPARSFVFADRLMPTSSRTLIGNLVLVVAGALLVALAAQVRIPLPFTPVPLTGQTFAVLLVGASLGTARGTAAVSLYLSLGLMGLPVFTGGGHGIEHLLGATGGYLIGFLVAAAALGRLAEKHFDRRVASAIPGMLLASLIIYAFGVVGLMIALSMDLARALEAGVYPFITGDLLKAGIAGLVLPAAWRLTRRVEDGV